MKINIFTYDYSEAQKIKENKIIINEENIKNDFIRVVKFIKTVSNTPKQFILIGKSIGSIPSLNYGFSSLSENSVSGFLLGMILISPVGCSIDEEINKKQSENLEMIKCPVFIIHSRKDTVFNYHHSVNLGMKIKNLFEWYPNTGDHYNIIKKNRTKFLTKIKMFVGLILSNYSNENKLIENVNGSYKNVSFKFEDNFIIQQTPPNSSNHKIYLNTTKVNSCFESYNYRSLNYKSNEDFITEDNSKEFFYPDNNSFLKSTCSSKENESPRIKPIPFSKKGDSFIIK